MKKLNRLCILAAVVGALSFASCKGKDMDENATPVTTTVDTTMSTSPITPPVVADEASLNAGVTDALKDYPAVKGEVSDSVINLSGSIKRSDWQKLMPTLNTLHPKRVNSSNLTIK